MGKWPVRTMTTVLLSTLLYVDKGWSQFEIVEPEPFRREEQDDRSFDYDKQSFIDRFSYRFDLNSYREWEKYREGFRISAGSISSDEMYVASQFQKKWFLDDWLFTTLRYRRDEDFDSRFDRVLLGVGLQGFAHWSFTTLADVVQEKEDIDLHFELGWQEQPRKPGQQYDETQGIGSRVRLALVLADRFFNGKNDEGFYSTKPVTVFAEGVHAFGLSSFVHFWANYNSKLSLTLHEDDSEFRYEQISGGARVDLALSEQLRLHLRLREEQGEQNRNGNPELTSVQDFDRESMIAEVQLDFQISEQISTWLGARYFFLDEDDQRINRLPKEREITRYESMGHTGVKWRISERLKFSPGVYLNYVDVTDEFPLNPQNSREDKELTGKFTFPVEIAFPYHDGRFIFQPTLEFPGHIFGGLNVQVQFLL